MPGLPANGNEDDGSATPSAARARDKEGESMAIRLTIDGVTREADSSESLLEVLNRSGTRIPQVCYHPQLGPIQTCDTCMVEVDGQLVRACATRVARTACKFRPTRAAARAAQREAFDRILGNHMLYCTVCDNNNGNCTVHNTTQLLGGRAPDNPVSSRSRTRSTTPTRSIATIPTSAFCAGAASRLARMCRSTKRCPSAGRTPTRASSGTAARPSANRAAFPAAIASPSVPATR